MTQIDTLSEDELYQQAITGMTGKIAAQDMAPVISVPDDGPVVLPGGYRRYIDVSSPPVEVKTAWVEELTGVDEERIAKARTKNSWAHLMDAVLLGGISKIGDQEPTDKDLQSMLLGDKEFLLLKISQATYGDTLEFEDYPCQACGEKVSFSFDKSEDIPIKSLEKADDSVFNIDLRKGRTARVRLMNGADQRVYEKGTTNAEVNSLILNQCLLEVDGVPVDPTENPGRHMGAQDRRTVLAELSERTPGPRYNEVTIPHTECGNEIEVAVTFVDLFPGL